MVERKEMRFTYKILVAKQRKKEITWKLMRQVEKTYLRFSHGSDYEDYTIMGFEEVHSSVLIS
jgi:hypothetical protein